MYHSKFSSPTFAAGILAALTLPLSFSVSAQTLVKSEPAGKGIYEIVVDNKDGAVYVAAVGQRDVSGPNIFKLDPKTLAIKDSISLGEAPGFGLGINQKTRILYTSNTRSNSVHAIDLKTGKVIATISNGAEKSHTREIVVDEKRNKVYVSDVGNPSTIWVIDGKTNQYLYSLEDAGKTATGLAIDSKKGLLYVSVMGENTINVYDVNSRKKIKSFSSGSESPMNIILDKKGERIFASGYKNNVLTVLNTATGKLLATVDVGESPIGVNYDAKRDRIYTANRQGKSLSIIDGKTYTLIKEVDTEGLSNSVAVNPKTGAAYVTNKQVGTRVREGQTPPTPLKNGDTVSLITP